MAETKICKTCGADKDIEEFYRGYPKDNFQLLCMNCNFAKGHRGECPHQTAKRETLK
jgi:hypothetical protein